MLISVAHYFCQILFLVSWHLVTLNAISNALWDNLYVAVFLNYRDKKIVRIHPIQIADNSKPKLIHNLMLLFIR